MSLHAVRCGDYGEPDGERTAKAGHRVMRTRIEDVRAGIGAAGEMREMHRSFGDHARTPGFDHEAWAAHCIVTPARRKAETDYLALEPRGRRA